MIQKPDVVSTEAALSELVIGDGHAAFLNGRCPVLRLRCLVTS